MSSVSSYVAYIWRVTSYFVNFVDVFLWCLIKISFCYLDSGGGRRLPLLHPLWIPHWPKCWGCNFYILEEEGAVYLWQHYLKLTTSSMPTSAWAWLTKIPLSIGRSAVFGWLQNFDISFNKVFLRFKEYLYHNQDRTIKKLTV